KLHLRARRRPAGLRGRRGRVDLRPCPHGARELAVRARTDQGARPMTRDRLRRTAGRWALSLVALAVAAIWAFPVYWMVNSSLMSNARLRSGTPSFWPVNATFSNYAAVIGGASLTSALRMSLAITAVAVVAAL